MPALDLWPLLSELKIRTKDARTINLSRTSAFAWAQREVVAEVERQYNAGKPVRIIILKARQLGLSTVTEAILFLWCFLHPGSFNLVLSKEKPDSEYLYTMTKRYYELGPFKDLYPTQYYSKEQLSFVTPPGSTVRIATAKKEEVARGMTVHGCHSSEVSRWGDMTDTIIPGLSTAMPAEHGTIWVLESTANGVGGYFYDTWQAAVAGESEFVPMFFAWYLHHEYEIESHHLSYRDLDEEEVALVEHMVAREVDPARVLAKLAWRRRKIASFPNGVDQFHEEYPTTPTEAFLSTGQNVFPLEQLDANYRTDIRPTRGSLFNNNGRLEFMEAVNGHTLVYKYPDPLKRQSYVVAVDPTWTLTGDPACIQVLNRATMEQVCVWRAHATPTSVGEIALGLAYYYNDALLNTEIEGGGRTVINVWRDANYRNIWTDRRPDVVKRAHNTLGWSTTQTSKNHMIGMTKGALARRQLVIRHPGTFYEMSQYVCLPTGRFGPARRSGHDDCVMAYMLAVVTVQSESQNLDWATVTDNPRGGPTPAALRQPVFAGQGTPWAPPDPTADRAQSPYFIDGEIEEWA